MISIIVAASTNNVIGQSNELPWYLPADLKHFSQLTTHHTVIMGRNTYESIIDKLGCPLPKRKNIVITRQTNYPVAKNVVLANSIDMALSKVDPDKETFIIGGAQIYNQFMPHVERIYLTRIHAHIDGDTYFDSFNEQDWELVDEQFHQRADNNSYDYSFLIYERKK
ncbi:MAG: dihydrofolate reductase [Patescibacteria group bacterium]